jgi:putative transposase
VLLAASIRRKEMPVGLRRIYGLGHLHFITFSCYRRLPLLKSKRARDVFVRELSRVRKELEFRLIGYVVMPEHVHLLISEPKKGTPSSALHKLKLQVARKLRKRNRLMSPSQMLLPFDREEIPLRAFWQARFHDFNVYSQQKKIEKLKYMHSNPLRRGLVMHPKDWPWSSWAFYRGGMDYLISMDVER